MSRALSLVVFAIVCFGSVESSRTKIKATDVANLAVETVSRSEHAAVLAERDALQQKVKRLEDRIALQRERLGSALLEDEAAASGAGNSGDGSRTSSQKDEAAAAEPTPWPEPGAEGRRSDGKANAEIVATALSDILGGRYGDANMTNKEKANTIAMELCRQWYPGKCDESTICQGVHIVAYNMDPPCAPKAKFPGEVDCKGKSEAACTGQLQVHCTWDPTAWHGMHPICKWKGEVVSEEEPPPEKLEGEAATNEVPSSTAAVNPVGSQVHPRKFHID